MSLLKGALHGYEHQQSGFSLSEYEIRTILDDHAYPHPTWQADKMGRAEEVVLHCTTREYAKTLGPGTRLGSF